MSKPIVNFWGLLQALNVAANHLFPDDVRRRIATTGMQHEVMINEIGFSPCMPADFDCTDVPSDYGILWENCPHKGNDDHLSIYVCHSGLFLRVTLGGGKKLINVELVPENSRFSLRQGLNTGERGHWINMRTGTLTEDIIFESKIPSLKGTVWANGRSIHFEDSTYNSVWVLYG